MRGKKTKGKQKISIRKIERDEDRLVTLSKRRKGIYTKLSEISILCGAEAGFLTYSGSGKPYTFGNPSFETVALRFLNGEGSSSSSSSSTVNARKLEELCQVYNSVVEKSDAEEESARVMASEEAAVQEDVWWKIDPKEVKEDEEVNQLLKKYEEFYEKLFEEVERRNNGGDVASSSCVASKSNNG